MYVLDELIDMKRLGLGLGFGVRLGLCLAQSQSWEVDATVIITAGLLSHGPDGQEFQLHIYKVTLAPQQHGSDLTTAVLKHECSHKVQASLQALHCTNCHVTDRCAL